MGRKSSKRRHSNSSDEDEYPRQNSKVSGKLLIKIIFKTHKFDFKYLFFNIFITFIFPFFLNYLLNLNFAGQTGHRLKYFGKVLNCSIFTKNFNEELSFFF